KSVADTSRSSDTFPSRMLSTLRTALGEGWLLDLIAEARRKYPAASDLEQLERELTSHADIAPPVRFEPSLDVLSMLPEIDPEGPALRGFVGREDLLRDVSTALKGLLVRSEQSRQDVRAIWLDGPGGMGKSSFLRRACLDSEIEFGTRLKVGL